MGFYEVGVYLAIIVVASICVFGIMWLLMKSMQPKRPKGRRRPALAAAVAGQSSRQLTQESVETGNEKKGKKEKGKKEKKKKAPGNKEEKLLKLKELPDNRLLQQGETAASSKGKAKNEKASAESQEESPAAAEDQNQEAAAQEPVADADGQENDGMTLADLPSMDTLTTEDEAPKETEIDLMSVFESEDAEDSSTADLAANLFDVDVQNIEKLGSEVSEFLNGMRSK